MNRVRKFGDKYQVLITPDGLNNPSFEVLLDMWKEPVFSNFYIEEYDSLNDGLYHSLKHPDLDWSKLVSIHQYIYTKLTNEVESVLNQSKITAEFIPHIVTPEELKNNMFDRVMVNGQRFTLVQQMNDIISFDIVCPWTTNLETLSKLLQRVSCLRVLYVKPDIKQNKVIYIVGETDIGTTYEIRLWPTLMYNWSKWVEKNKHNPATKQIAFDMLQKIKQQQKQLDESLVLF